MYWQSCNSIALSFKVHRLLLRWKPTLEHNSAGLLIQFLRRQSQGHRAKQCAAPGTLLPNKELQTFLPGNTILLLFSSLSLSFFSTWEKQTIVWRQPQEETKTLFLICLIKMLWAWLAEQLVQRYKGFVRWVFEAYIQNTIHDLRVIMFGSHILPIIIYQVIGNLCCLHSICAPAGLNNFVAVMNNKSCLF